MFNVRVRPGGKKNSSLKLSKIPSNHSQILAGNYLTFSSFLSSLLLFGSWILFDVKNIKEIEMNKRWDFLSYSFVACACASGSLS